MVEDIVIFGTGGFGREVAWLIEEINKEDVRWNLLGFIDDFMEVQGKIINGYPVLGTSDWVNSCKQKIGVLCCLGDPNVREIKIKKMSQNPYVWHPTIISNHAVISSPTTKIGKGCIICASSIVTVNVSIGDFVHINLDCTVGHDTVIDDYVTLYPSVNVSGNVRIGNHTEIGTGTQIIQGLDIGNKTIVGAGSVVIRNIPDNATAVGNPAKVIKINGERV